MPMRWMLAIIITLIAVGGTVLYYTFPQTTPATQQQTPQVAYKDPYVGNPNATIPPRQTATGTQQTTQTTYRTDNAAPVTQPQTVIESTTGVIDEDPGYDRRVMEDAFFAEVNRQRLINGLQPLEIRKDLSQTARKYSEELAAGAQAEAGYDPRTAVVELRHFGDTFGLTVVERLAYKDIYDARIAGENILSLPLDNSTYNTDDTLRARSWRSEEELVTSGVRSWMLSPLHRANILTKDYDFGGVGVYRLDNILVVTQVFIQSASCGYYKGPCCDSGNACFDNLICTTHDRDEEECRQTDE